MQMMINRFSVQNAYLEPIGEALYIGPSIHDHSCSPDAGYTFNGSQLIIRAARDMTITNARQVRVCVTYLDH